MPFLFFFGLSGYAQTTTPSVPNKSEDLLNTMGTMQIHYCCPKCTYTSDKPGTCPIHNVNLIKEGTYYCPTDLTTSKTLRKCPKCGKMMKKMDATPNEGALAPADAEKK